MSTDRNHTNHTQDADVIRIDVDRVLRTRLPRHYRYIPRPLIRWVERTICQDEMNRLIEENHGKRDAEFCRGVLNYLGITYTVHGLDILREAVGKRPLLVSNHPLGGLDGIIYIDLISSIFGPDMKFLVNDLLMAIDPLNGVFLPINKHGSQSRQASKTVDEALESDAPIVIFPAGLVSRKGPKGVIADLKWQKMFVNKAIRHRRDIIPMFFSGNNSKFFYNFAKLRTRLGLKFNIEMIRLPKELFLAKGRHFDIYIGSPIDCSTLQGGPEAARQAEDIKKIVYNLRSSSKTNH